MRTLKNRPHALIFPESEGRTEQSHKDDCDINKIMVRALRGQASPYVREDLGSYGDANTLSYFEAHTIVAEANSMFYGLPSKIRSRFHNDPGEFLEFTKDPKNTSEAVELGLIKKLPNAESPEITNPTPAAPAAEKPGGKGGAAPQPGEPATT